MPCRSPREGRAIIHTLVSQIRYFTFLGLSMPIRRDAFFDPLPVYCREHGGVDHEVRVATRSFRSSARRAHPHKYGQLHPLTTYSCSYSEVPHLSYPFHAGHPYHRTPVHSHSYSYLLLRTRTRSTYSSLVPRDRTRSSFS